VIRLHRLGKPGDTFFLNPDLVLSIETTPDTLLALTTHTKVLVSETPDEVVEAIREWRASILSTVTRRAPRASGAALALIHGSAGRHVDPEGGAR
jgi:uncharacterized protein YlzI (FlbEa/FlbD family)